jgi:hypothetical protein
MAGKGPIYGVELLSALPLDGGMKQALPNRADLQLVREVSERTVAGFEVLTEHYRRLLASRDLASGKARDVVAAWRTWAEAEGWDNSEWDLLVKAIDELLAEFGSERE